jgi:hypothetical protein
MLTSPPQNRYRCRFCGRELPAWLPVAKRPESSMLLYHLGQHHLEVVGLYLRGGRGAWKVDKEVAIMWQPHRCYSLTALALGCVLSTWLWAATAAPAKRPAPATPSAPVPAPTPPEAEHVLALFKAKAEQFQRFLSQDPVILLKQDFSTFHRI